MWVSELWWMFATDRLLFYWLCGFSVRYVWQCLGFTHNLSACRYLCFRPFFQWCYCVCPKKPPPTSLMYVRSTSSVRFNSSADHNSQIQKLRVEGRFKNNCFFSHSGHVHGSKVYRTRAAWEIGFYDVTWWWW